MRVIPVLASLILIFVLLPGHPLQADGNTADLVQMIHAGKVEIYRFQLDEALGIFRAVQQKFPDYPHGFFYEAYITAIYYSQDRTNSELDSLLQLTVRQAIHKGEKFRENTNSSAEALYYLGVSHGVLGIYHVLNSSYFQGYIHGRRGKNYLEQVVKTDSSYYDAYLGLGIYHYYVDLLPGIVKFFASILGFHGDRKAGMAEILQASRRGEFFQTEAEFTYAALRYFLEGDYSNSLQIFQKLNKKYPDNPALALMVGYHFRRYGRINNALSYFESISTRFSEKLPQIIVMKYYNLGVCYYRMNQFDRAEEYFNLLLDPTLRKSQYYQAALAYYKGLLSGIQSRQDLSGYYFKMIYDNKETQYWYNLSRMFAAFPIDTVMQRYLMAENAIYTYDRVNAGKHIQILVSILEGKGKVITNPYLPFLIRDVQAKLAFQNGQIQYSRELYAQMINNVGKLKDDFQTAWIYISYARVLRELRDWDQSQKMLEKAGSTNDEYTRLIIEREKYILKNRRENSKT